MIYIAVDPGAATGVVWYRDEEGVGATSTITEWREVPRLIDDFTASERAVQLILEEYRPSAKKKHGYQWSTKLNGAMEVLAYRRMWNEPAYQTASDAKTTVSDRQLRESGLWIGKTDHERDACRHLVRYLAIHANPWARRVLAGPQL